MKLCALILATASLSAAIMSAGMVLIVIVQGMPV